MRAFRVVAVDDASFYRKQKSVDCVGVVARGDAIEGVLFFRVRRDGFDSTHKLLRAIKRSRFKQGLKLVLLNGVALAGLNIVDMQELSQSLRVPVLALTRNKPHGQEIEKAVFSAPASEKRMKLLAKAGEASEFVVAGTRLYAHFTGATHSHATTFLSSFNGFPEPLRLAHLIASALARGESKGRA